MSGPPDHYATLGLARDCTAAEIRAAYRDLARQSHPDLHPGDPAALARTQALNAAYAVLSDPERRRIYDGELTRTDPVRPARRMSATRLRQAVAVGFADLLRGTTLTIRVRDPAQPASLETVAIILPPGTAPGTIFRCARGGPDHHHTVTIRVQGRRDPRFKRRGSDLCCDLVIPPRRATPGAMTTLRGVGGQALPVRLPDSVTHGTVIRVTGEGLPRPRGGRGDLLVRVRILRQPR